MSRHHMICKECGIKMNLARESEYDGMICSECDKTKPREVIKHDTK